MYNSHLFFFYVNILQKHHIAKKLYLIQIKAAFLWIGIQGILSELIKNLSNNINVICFVDVDQDIIRVNNHKNI